MDTNNTAAIIGGGVIGVCCAARFLLMGWDVRIFDPDPEAERKVGKVLANARRSLPGIYEVSLPDEGRLSFHPTIGEAVAGAAWIQESVPERIEVKLKTFREVQTDCDDQAIIASSTSGFTPSQLQENAARPEQIVVAHPFNPVYLLPLVELVPTRITPVETTEKASAILTQIGMYPLHVRSEIEAHIADRFLEAAWREALWLIKDGIATTREIDDAIRYGFGLRWGQMGLFETYRVAGGEAGMRHFIAQFAPSLKWNWTKLMDVPELDEELVNLLAEQSDQQSGHLSIRELERRRDNNLVAKLRALKSQDWGAGAHLNLHDVALKRAVAGGTRTQGDAFASLSILRATLGCDPQMPDAMPMSEDGSLWFREWLSCPAGRIDLMLHPGGHKLPKDWLERALDWFEERLAER